MNRRSAVKRVAILMGGALSASTLAAMLDSCQTKPSGGSGPQFSEDEDQLISRMADLLIPKTDTPGALEAGVPPFIVMMMQECYGPDDQKQFHEGLQAFDKQCETKYGSRFLKLDAAKQLQALTGLDSQVLGKPGLAKDDPLNFYRHFKELTLLGFFSSKPGATETLRYVKIPGRYDGDIPYHKGDKAWAT
jgi:hypothetical protein